MAVRHNVSPAKDSDRIGGRAWLLLIQERAPLFVMGAKIIGAGNDANSVLPVRELELNLISIGGVSSG
jgi:hypothetical protein